MSNEDVTGYGPKYHFNKEGRVAIKPEFEPFQANDGGAHFAYYDDAKSASFVWDGSNPEIQVCIGGYGEPVDHTIPAPDLSLPQWSAVGVLGSFENVCRSHADRLEEPYG